MENSSKSGIDFFMYILGIDKLYILYIENTSRYDIDKPKITTPQR